MTKLPLQLDPHRKDGVWIVDAEGEDEAGPYRTQIEAKEDLLGLKRFYKEHPDYLNPVFEEKQKMSTEVKTPLEVTRDEAVAMFMALGLKTSDKWNKTRMTEKIAGLVEAYDADTKLPDEATQATFDSILAAIVNDQAIELVASKVAEDEAPAEAPAEGAAEAPAEAPAEGAEAPAPKAEKPVKAPKAEKPPKAPKAEKPVKAPKAEKPPKAPKAVVEKDKFGLKVGSKLANFAALLTAEPQSMKDLMDKDGTGRYHYPLLNSLIEKGFVTKTEDDKYALVAAK